MFTLYLGAAYTRGDMPTYAVVDRVTKNVLGECTNFAAAEALFLEFVGSDARAAHDIEIVPDDGLPDQG